MHKSFEELQLSLSAATSQVKLEGVYAHYKDEGSRYKAIGLCILESTDEVAVRYVSLESEDIEFIRPLTEWLEEIDGRQRFSLINRGE